jgi:hypothetical protein
MAAGFTIIQKTTTRYEPCNYQSALSVRLTGVSNEDYSKQEFAREYSLVHAENQAENRWIGATEHGRTWRRA